MNQDLYRPFGDHFSAKADDFKASESYRWVRLGIRLLMIGYVLLLPAVAAIAFFVAQEKGLQVPDLPPQYFIAPLIAGALAVILILIGCVLLRFAPEEDERAAADRYLWAYGIAIAATAGSSLLGLQPLELVRRIATAYGSYYLLAYFPVLAENRDNPSLTWWANFTNRFFVILIFGAIGMGVLAGMKVIPLMVSVGTLVVMFAVMYVAWMKTLWHALQATRPISKDFEPDNSFG